MNMQHSKRNEVVRVRSDKPGSSQPACVELFVSRRGERPLARSLLPRLASQCKDAFNRDKVSRKAAFHLD